MQFYTSKRGFSLVELMIVVTIICVIAAIAIQTMRDTSQDNAAAASTTAAALALENEGDGGNKELTSTHYFQSYDYSTVTTVGSHSWVPINHGFWEATMPNEILNLLSGFEKEMGVIITNWKMFDNGRGVGGGIHLYGIWVDHKPAG
ncbi:MAG: prepilin-type N-terminal cleavage/methylation domain-containing protein [Patescibacteria group bacterium]